MWAELRAKLGGFKYFLEKFTLILYVETNTIIMISGLDEGLHYHLS